MRNQTWHRLSFKLAVLCSHRAAQKCLQRAKFRLWSQVAQVGVYPRRLLWLCSIGKIIMGKWYIYIIYIPWFHYVSLWDFPSLFSQYMDDILHIHLYVTHGSVGHIQFSDSGLELSPLLARWHTSYSRSTSPEADKKDCSAIFHIFPWGFMFTKCIALDCKFMHRTGEMCIMNCCSAALLWSN